MTALSEASDDRPAGSDMPSAHLPAGYTVGGKYVIKRMLGEGGNGSVYEGEHTQIGHRVAIKVVHKALAEREDIVARFAREARFCATIRNRNVGQVYDVGELPNGAPYMVMELHEGRSLATVLAENDPLPIAVAIDITQQLLLGLQAAHDHGVVHRDVKPDNLMLVQESSGHVLVKLVDFGIGKSVGPDIRARGVTQEGIVVGSPDYMSPEALKGEEVDARADVYAAGVVLYEMITGRVPFDAGSITELGAAILRDPVAPPRDRRPDCPPQLEHVIEQAMVRDVDKRYQRANDMREALERVRRECGYSTDVPTRYSLKARAETPAKAARAGSDGGYALESERTHTAELRLPIQRTGTRLVLAGAALAIVAAVSVWLWPTSRESPPSAAGQTKSATTAATSNAAPAVSVATPSPAAVEPAAPEAVQPAAARSEPSEPAAVSGKHRDMRARNSEGAASAPIPDALRSKRRVAAPEPKAAASSAARVDGPEVNQGDLLQQAAAAFVRGQMPRSRALYREATERAPGSADAWRGLGMVSSRMGERSEAARALKRYLSLRPNAPDTAAIEKKLSEL